MEMLGILIPILLGLGSLACLFGIRYLRNKENMAMIQNGMDPSLNKPQPHPYQTLKWGLLLMGLGIGLFLAYVLDHTVFDIPSDVRRHNDANVPIYFALISIFGGLGLFVSYVIEKKNTLDKE